MPGEAPPRGLEPGVMARRRCRANRLAVRREMHTIDRPGCLESYFAYFGMSQRTAGKGSVHHARKLHVGHEFTLTQQQVPILSSGHRLADIAAGFATNIVSHCRRPSREPAGRLP